MPQLNFLRKITTIWHSLPIRYRGAIIIALPFSCLIFTLFASVWSKENSLAIYQRIDHTKTIILDSNRLLGILLDAETGSRGYAISQNKNFLEPYNQAIQKLPEILNHLEQNLSNQAQINRFKIIENLAQQNITILEQRIAEVDRKKQNNIPPSADILLYQGKDVMDNIRREINAFQEEELRQLDIYRQELDDISDKNNLVLWITLAISIASYIGTIYLFSKLDWQIAGQQLQLQGKKSLLKGIMENVVDGIITLDKQDKIDSFNQAAVTMFGYPSEEVIGEKINLLIPEINQTEKDQFTNTISATHQSLPMYMEGNRQVGANFPVEISISNLENGQGKMVIVRDITEQMQIREKLEANVQELSRLSLLLANTNQALTERNQELDNFAYIASHDLKAPLRGIRNLSQWLEEDIKDDLAPENQQQLELLRKRVYRMEALIDGLLEYSRVGRIEIAREKVDVNELLAEIIDSLNPPATFNIQISGEMPVFITKKLLLSQVFANLISNAIKHHPRNNGNISISVEDNGDFYKFAVADDGCGIDIQHQDRIFGIFQTLESRDKKENTGVGLSIVKKIIESEGCKIILDSELGKGATFRFTWLK
ncbi:CHASE3 domain-containing protein [Plectonema cf. radiosum LEGE 06105]|uniref:histidine kinase n=1 Tax=Plectonema cf. radiosum LEGE 06105 TaxID=945769 RepID=A0A8J7F2Z5_9CYAN|nr:CHASE3 domain-containing protein [Plectonema radiosum]MBE9213870.1 CHASE3 domain-containing protein [Plectonema cf. radiosum LEGE 06105]